jgi:NAD(P)-dependent dehydrogenase (short-subunit alcohol dehydrogenase family)
VAQVPHVGIPAYASAKAALETFSTCIALEYAHERIRVNCISPGNVATGSSLKVYNEDENYRKFVDRVTPFGGRNTLEAVADVVLFLCSPLASELNGQVLHVDHGITIPKIG